MSAHDQWLEAPYQRMYAEQERYEALWDKAFDELLKEGILQGKLPDEIEELIRERIDVIDQRPQDTGSDDPGDFYDERESDYVA